MSRPRSFARLACACAGALLLSSPVLADKPAGVGKEAHGGAYQEKGERGNQGDRPGRDDRAYERGDEHGNYRGDDRRAHGSAAYAFDERSRRVFEDYYGRGPKSCPPGLAKKNTGCLPPGQAKKWQRGAPLPPDLRVWGLPPDLYRRLPPPPEGHRYVRVASDILMIAIGTQMVVDAIEDIAR